MDNKIVFKIVSIILHHRIPALSSRNGCTVCGGGKMPGEPQARCKIRTLTLDQVKKFCSWLSWCRQGRTKTFSIQFFGLKTADARNMDLKPKNTLKMLQLKEWDIFPRDAILLLYFYRPWINATTLHHIGWYCELCIWDHLIVNDQDVLENSQNRNIR